MRQQSEDVADSALGRHSIRKILRGDLMNEFLSRSNPRNRFVRLPSLVIDAADEGRELGAEIDGFFQCKAVAQVMENGAKNGDRFLRVCEIAVVT